MTDRVEWLMSQSINRLVLAIKSVESAETLERWQFDIHTDEQAAAGIKPPKGSSSGASGTGSGSGSGKKKDKTEKEVQGEIREIMKQITSSVTFLPILEEQCEWHPSLYRPASKRDKISDDES